MQLFIDEAHEYNFHKILSNFEEKELNIYLKSFVFVISSNFDFTKNIELIIDYETNTLLFETMFSQPYLTGATKSLLLLAFTLYTDSSYIDIEAEKVELSIHKIFKSLDYRDFAVAINAIKYRYDK